MTRAVSRSSRKASAPEVFNSAIQSPGGSGPFEQLARAYEYEILGSALSEPEAESPIQRLSTSLMFDFLAHTDNINVKLSQVYRYLMVGREARRRWHEPSIEFVGLRRHSSFFPFLPRPSAFRVLGGGYFTRIHGGRKKDPFGIAIDPGGDYIENLYRCGFSLADIDMIIVIHDHADHMASLDPLLSLLGYRMKLGDKRFRLDRRLVILGNRSVVERYEFLIQRSPVVVEQIQQWRQLRERNDLSLPVDLEIDVVQGMHKDTRGGCSVGVRLSLSNGGPSVGITGDTGSFVGEQGAIRAEADCGSWTKHWASVLSADLVVAHVSSVPRTQLRQIAGIPVKARWLKQVWDDLPDEVRSQTQFAFWSQSHDQTARLWGEPPKSFMPSSQHLYLAGIVAMAEEFKRLRLDKERLFVVFELREELGTFRRKIAEGLTAHILGSEQPRRSALTADIGLNVLVDSHGAKVQCFTCAIDNDLTEAERYHDPHDIREVCVKGKDEGMFYNCPIHDPSRLTDETFVEQMERYDIFRRGRLA